MLITHEHYDHISGENKIREKYKWNILISENDKEMLEDDSKNLSNSFFNDVVVKDAITFSDGGILNIIGEKIQCIHTPGHTAGGTCFYIESEKILFSGDTIFRKDIGRTDLYGGDIDAMVNSITNVLFNLPDDVVVYPGHGYDTRLGNEKNNNVILEYIKNN